jgi:predicted nucleotidyltransferase
MNSLKIQPASEIAALVKAALCDEPGLKLAILYGSAATGRIRAGSDVDIALLFVSSLGAERKMELISRLESELQRDVDLVDLFDLSGTILRQVLHKGRVLVQTQSGALAGLVRKDGL